MYKVKTTANKNIQLFRSMRFFLFLASIVSGCTNNKILEIPAFITNISEVPLVGVPYRDQVKISDIAINSKGFIFVCDKNNKRIFCLSPEGHYLREFRKRTQPSGDSYTPGVIAIDRQDQVYVVYEDGIFIYNHQGQLLRTFTIDIYPGALVIDEEDNLYLSGYHNNGGFHKYDSKGNHIASYGRTYNHPNIRVKRLYSGGSIDIAADRIYFNYKIPYEIVAINREEGWIISSYTRPKLDFKPNFTITGNSYSVRSYARNLKVIAVENIVMNSYYKPNKGVFIDIYNRDLEIIEKNIKMSPHFRLLTADRQGQIYFKKMDSNKKYSIFRGTFNY